MAQKSTDLLSPGTNAPSKGGGSSNASASNTSKAPLRAAGPDPKPGEDKPQPGVGKKSDAESLLKADHRKVEKLFQKYEGLHEADEKQRLGKQICKELIVHTQLEEELFYPACRAEGVEDDMLDEAQVEHDGAKVLITQLITLPASSDYYDAKVKVLSEYIKHHVGEEERSSDGIFAKARKAGVDMDALGKRIQSRKEELLAQEDEDILQPPVPRSLEIPDFINRSFKENQAMANYQHRDDEGRFTGNGNSGYSGGRHASSQDYDDRYGQGRQGGGYNSRDRDDYGRFTGGDDGRSDVSYGRGRGNYDDDRDYGHSQGRGQGWHGDPEGHSRAARGGRGDYDDDRDYRSSGNRGDQGHGGWYGDSERHSQAAQRGYQSSNRSNRGGYDDDRGDDYRNQGNRGGQGYGHGGWYGDSEGHSQAAQRGYQSHNRSSRGGYDDDRDNYRSSGNQNQGERGHGGWFGDSRGHAEAARRGWENR